jgi:alanine racemase
MKEALSYLEISRGNLLHNVSIFKETLIKDRKISAVVKANAYGHGLKEVAQILEDTVDYFQVDDIEELRELRSVSHKPCLVLGYVLTQDLEELVQLDGVLGVFDLTQMEKLNEIGQRQNKVVSVHVEIDAFLGRLGIMHSEAQLFLDQAKKLNNVSIDAIYSHFSDIEDSENLEHAELQYKTLHDIAQKNELQYHIAATSGILADEQTHWNGSIVRLGIGMYGIWPSERLQRQWQKRMSLKPVLTWKTHVAQVKTLPPGYPVGYGKSYVTKQETVAAVIPQGYSDGYDRLFSNNGEVLIKGIRCPIIGRIAMNMFVVDASKVGEISQEEEVVLLGGEGQEAITPEELANRIGTINYEIVARISALLERRVY